MMVLQLGDDVTTADQVLVVVVVLLLVMVMV